MNQRRANMDHLIDDNDRLKRCPFCGGEAEFGQCSLAEDNDNAGAEFISCVQCDATTALVFPCMDEAKTMLMERWNKRALPRSEEDDARHDTKPAAGRSG